MSEDLIRQARRFANRTDFHEGEMMRKLADALEALQARLENTDANLQASCKDLDKTLGRLIDAKERAEAAEAQIKMAQRKGWNAAIDKCAETFQTAARLANDTATTNEAKEVGVTVFLACAEEVRALKDRT